MVTVRTSSSANMKPTPFAVAGPRQPLPSVGPDTRPRGEVRQIGVGPGALPLIDQRPRLVLPVPRYVTQPDPDRGSLDRTLDPASPDVRWAHLEPAPLRL